MKSKPGSYMMITGAGGGLGSAFALACAHRGENLILLDQLPDISDLIHFLEQVNPIKIMYFACDLADTYARQALIEKLRASGIKLHGLINLVGREIEGRFDTLSREQVLSLLQLNTTAMADLSLAVLKQRNPARRFNMINVASMAGFFPMPHKAIYAATKRFIISFSIALREEIKSFGNVLVLCPAGLPTNAESMRKIFLQGFWGRLTAQDTSQVVRKTLRLAEKNKAIYIPGFTNRCLVGLSHMLPETLLARYLAKRWLKTEEGLNLWRITHPRQ
jgi:hypothetical protein